MKIVRVSAYASQKEKKRGEKNQGRIQTDEMLSANTRAPTQRRVSISRSDVIGTRALRESPGERFNIKTLRAEASRGETADRSHFDPAYASSRVDAFPARRAEAHYHTGASSNRRRLMYARFVSVFEFRIQMARLPESGRWSSTEDKDEGGESGRRAVLGRGIDTSSRHG